MDRTHTQISRAVNKMYIETKLKARITHQAIKESSETLNNNTVVASLIVLDEGESACNIHADVMLGFKPEDEDK